MGWAACEGGGAFETNAVGSDTEVGNVTGRLRVEDRIEGLRIRVGGTLVWVGVMFVEDDGIELSEPSSFSFSLSFALSLSFLELGLGGGLWLRSSSR